MTAKKATKKEPDTIAATQIAQPEIVKMKVSDLKAAPYNPRKIDDSAMAGLTKSLERFGYVDPIIWNKRSRFVVGGHQRLKVLRAKNMQEVPIVVVDLDDTEEKALNVALNSPHIAGEFTDDLQALLDEIRAKDTVLFDELRLDKLLRDVEAGASKGDAEAMPPIPTEAKTKLGDIYELGNHRLLCGDSTNAEDVRRILEGARVDIMVTDPPYGVDYGAKNALLNSKDGGKRIEKNIENDVGKDYRKWFASFLSLVPWSDYATFYICMSCLELHNLRLAIEDCELKWGDYLIWVKNNHVLGRKDYDAKHEFVVYGWPKKHRFYAEEHRTTVLEYARPQTNDLHPTMKPIELIRQLLVDGSTGAALVYEPFCGSGTTLIASEILGRQCRAIELDPIYCDVIVKRWEDFTGKKAVLRGEER